MLLDNCRARVMSVAKLPTVADIETVRAIGDEVVPKRGTT